MLLCSNETSGPQIGRWGVWPAADQDSSDDMALLLVRCDEAGGDGAEATRVPLGEPEHDLRHTG